jgi:hypothetical protein
MIYRLDTLLTLDFLIAIPPLHNVISTLQGKSHLCIPFLGIARPQSQFPHSCVSERFIVFPGLVHIFPCSRIGRPILEIYESLTVTDI